jgi:hypothetical protein
MSDLPPLDAEARSVDAVPLPSHLAISPHVERVYDPDRGAMLAALRVALGLPCPTHAWSEEHTA